MTFELKYDGIRAQIHYFDGHCQIFGRNLQNISTKFPEVNDSVLSSKSPDVKNFIIDAEIIAINTTTRKVLPFQNLMNLNSQKINNPNNDTGLCLFAFDILCYNNESLLMSPLFERRNLLESNFKQVLFCFIINYIRKVEDKFKFAEYINTNNIDKIQEFLNYSVKSFNFE